MKRLADQSFYEILEIARDAPTSEVERAYERAKALYGPGSLATYTLMDPEEAAFLSRRIEEAYAILLDPVMRSAYNAGLAPDVPTGARRPRPPVVPPVRAPPPEPVAAPVPASAAPLPTGVPPAASAPPMATVPVAAPEPAAAEAALPIPAVEIATLLTPVPVVESTGVRPPGGTPVAPLAVESSVSPVRPAVSRPPAPPPLPSYSIPDGVPWTGEILRRVRESRGLTLQQLADRTKVTRHHLENIEADRYASLPAAVYLRGILINLAKELRLDGQKVARSYLEQAIAAPATPSPPMRGR